jgi:hypothetical protein
LSTKFKAHDEENEARIGDTVLIEESRPLSATKRWRLVEVVTRGGDHALPGEVVADEEATFEAIHAAAHPGRTTDTDDETDTGAGTTDTSDGATSDDATSDEEATR